VETSKENRASLIGITLALMFTGAVLQAQQQPLALPAPRQGQQPPGEESQTRQAPGEAETLHLQVGRSLVVSSPSRIKRIWVADPSIIDAVAESPNQILINGKAAGGVPLVLWDETGRGQEFYVYVDLDGPSMGGQGREAFPDQTVWAEVQRKLKAWRDWIIIASIAVLAGAIIDARQHLASYSRKFDLHYRKTGSPDIDNKSELALTPPLARAEEHPVEEAIVDRVTGLKTHGCFREALDKEWRRSACAGRQLSLLFVGLDNFKRVNDRMGRREGEKVLTAVTTLLEAQSRQLDVVAWYGADEFAILMPETNVQQAETLAGGLRAALEADRLLRAHEVTASLGIATFPDHGQTPEEILRVADSGMSLAKDCGGNCVKLAALNPKPANAERIERLLGAYQEGAENGMLSTAFDASSPCLHKFEPQKPFWNTIATLAFAVEAKDPYMKGHSRAVSRLAARIAIQSGLSQAEVEEIRLAGIVHDIGKIDVPEDMLMKPTPLTAEEFEIMKSHAVWGAKMLESLNVKPIERIVRHHHERYDGKGYPDGLVGSGIPLGARIVAVAECFHSMVSDLPYQSARTFEDALKELRRCSGTQFDPKVVATFLDWVKIYDETHTPQRREHAAVFSEPEEILQAV